MMRIRCAIFLAGILAAMGVWQIGQSAVVLAKAWLAPVLIEHSWAKAEAGATGDALRPWPWADMVPVAKLRFPDLAEERIALSGGSGSAMAFGPTQIPQAPLPAFFGHRDTHFTVLRDLDVGDEIEWQAIGEPARSYRILETAVLHKDQIRVPASEDGGMIALVTCWPFDAVDTEGAMRYVVLARLSEEPGVDKLAALPASQVDQTAKSSSP